MKNINGKEVLLMLQSERNDKILEYISLKDVCTIGEISKKYNISRVTVHRILNSFQESGLVEKVRGGVKVASQPQGTEKRFNIRLRRRVEEKKQIAQKAMQYVKEGATIFIDASSTSVYFAREIVAKFSGHLTVVTNSPIIVYELMNAPNINVISTGGEVQYELTAMVGTFAVNIVKNMQFTTAFISSGGVSIDRGITTAQSSLAELIQVVCDRSEEVILLVDSTKFSTVAPMTIGDISMVDVVISDHGIDRSIRERLDSRGIKLIT
jgi:DeoR/GlpR family transcriptional regulator of sugar metabolism